MEVPKPAVQVLATGREFRQFLLKNNVLALALGVVIGGAVGNVVKSAVADLIMPLVGVITPAGNWRTIAVDFWRFRFTVGNFLGALLDFAIIAVLVFLATKLFIRAAAPPPTKTCPECREGIHPEAARCKFCTAVQPKPAADTAG